MPGKVDYNKQVFIQLNNFAEAEVEWIDKMYSMRRSCIPLIREKMDRIAEVIKSVKFESDQSASMFVWQKSDELAYFTRACIHSKEELPSSLNEAIARIDQLVAVNKATDSLSSQVNFWHREFQKSDLAHAMGCIPSIRDKAIEMQQQLEQMKSFPPAHLSQMSEIASTHLDDCASRCIFGGPQAVPRKLPPLLRSNGSHFRN